jgi:hypothetical protein
MRKIILLIAGILLLAVNANAAFPVSEAGLAAYVNINGSIDPFQAINAFQQPLDVVNETYIIGRISGFDGKVYVGADGWVIAYYSNTTNSSRIVEWGQFSSDPSSSISNITSTTTFDYPIRKVSEAIGADFSKVKPDIQYYNFKYPDATQMKIIIDTKIGSWYETNEFFISIPSSKTIYESSYSDFCNTFACNLQIDRVVLINNNGYNIITGKYDLSRDTLHIIGVAVYNGYGTGKTGVAWVLLT